MFVIIGWVVALVGIFGGFVGAGGHLAALMQPLEFVIIGGGAFGAFIAAQNAHSLKHSLAGIASCFKGSRYTKAFYMELIGLLFELLAKARKEGLMSLENDVEEPDKSPIFAKYPNITAEHHLVEFITDYMRMMVGGNLNAMEIENLMDSEIETHHQEAHGPVAALARLAGALPAFGIVAAVLGVIDTMGSVGQPPAVLGGKIASALVGTFLGILLAYAVVEPLGGLLEQKSEDGSKELQCIKTTLLASMQGYNPSTAIEFGRKVLFSTERPTFLELESHVRGKK